VSRERTCCCYMETLVAICLFSGILLVGLLFAAVAIVVAECYYHKKETKVDVLEKNRGTLFPVPGLEVLEDVE
jgi:hypothetical protein